MTRRRSFTSHACRPLVTAPGLRQEIADLIALEAHALGVGGNEDAKRLQAGVFNLILQIGGDLHFRLADCRMLQAGHLHPRVDLLHVQASRAGTCKARNASTPFCRMPDFCGSNCVYPSRAATCKRIPCSGTISKAPCCLPASRNTICGTSQPRALFTPGPARVMAKDCAPLRLAQQVQSDDAPGFGLRFRPLAQRRAADGFDVEPAGQQKAQIENSRPRDVRREIVRQHGAVFAQRQGIVVSTRTSGCTAEAFKSTMAWCRSNERRGARSVPEFPLAARPRRRRENPPG